MRDSGLVCDLVVKSPYAVRTANYTEGAAVRDAEASKVRHYKSAIKNFSEVRPCIVIAAMDTYGRFGDEFNAFIQHESTRLFDNDTDGLRSQWTTLFRQRMSCALQRANADALRWFRNTAWTPVPSARHAHAAAAAAPARPPLPAGPAFRSPSPSPSSPPPASGPA